MIVSPARRLLVVTLTQAGQGLQCCWLLGKTKVRRPLQLCLLWHQTPLPWIFIHCRLKSSTPCGSVQGRQFPVDVLYTATPEDSYVDAAITASLQIHCDEAEGGDILVFLTGQVRPDAVTTSPFVQFHLAEPSRRVWPGGPMVRCTSYLTCLHIRCVKRWLSD